MADTYYKSDYTGAEIDAAIGKIVSGKIDADAAAAEQAAKAAQAAQQAIEDMTVSAVTLEPDSLAQVVKTEQGGVVDLQFRIPRGKQGEQGERGAQGNPGVSVASDGFWGLAIDQNGDLILYYDGDAPPDLEISEDGDLIYTVGGAQVNLGHVVGDGNAMVTSFKGRTGAVTPQQGDYSVDQISGAASIEYVEGLVGDIDSVLDAINGEVI